MPIIDGIAHLRENMEEWRHAIHAHPETAFEEIGIPPVEDSFKHTYAELTPALKEQLE